MPVATDVTPVWVEGNERRKFEPSVTIYGNDRTRKSIQPFYGCYDPLSYPLFFPRGESGWHQGLPKDKITMEDANARNGDDPGKFIFVLCCHRELIIVRYMTVLT